ncbi:MAG: alpha/beta hydrolase [Xanthobacteraceae bacterium]
MNKAADQTESAETLSDRQKVEQGYALVNAMWKTQGGGATLRYVHHLPHGRALPLGLDLAEVDRVIASVDSFYRGGYRDWPTQWFKAADHYLERGREARRKGHERTAAQMLLSAAVCYHLAGYMHHDIGRLLPETKQSMLLAAETYWEAAALFSPPAHRAEIPYGDTTLRPFLRLPRGTTRPPCVILIGGANSNMINMHAVSDYYLERGMATVGLDGPGQGEFRARTGRALRVRDYDQALAAVADWLEQDGRVDGKRIGIYGRATGSLLAMHAAAGDKRFKAVVAHPAGFNFVDFFEQAFAHTLISHRLEMCSFLGAKTLEEGTRLVRQELTLEDVADRIDFPILSVCSADDETMPTTQSMTLQRRVKGPVEIVTFPGKGHGGPSRLSLPLEADWMRERLAV